VTRQPWNPVRILVLVLVAGVVAVTLLAVGVVLAFVLASDPDDADDAPAAPVDLCAVVGRDDLAAWLPGAAPVSDVDGSGATCEATADGDAGRFRVEVTRYSDVRSGSAEAQAEDWFDLRCDTIERSAGLGDDSCLEVAGSGSTARAEVVVRDDGDLVRVAYDHDPLTPAEAEERVLTAATRILDDLAR
jgi:hypothetical protein